MCASASAIFSIRGGYQTGLALKAFEAGGLAGVGPGAGTIKYRLPDAHTDFIFAVAGEEFGIALCILMALLFGVVTIRLLLRAARSRDPFCSTCIFGPRHRCRDRGLH